MDEFHVSVQQTKVYLAIASSKYYHQLIDQFEESTKNALQW